MASVPSPFELVLLALGAMRFTRLVGWDSITDPIRSRVTGHHHGSHRSHGRRVGSNVDRPTWMLFLTCPWCLGFWISLLLWACWLVWPHATLVAVTPFAINAVVGMLVKNLDA